MRQLTTEKVYFPDIDKSGHLYQAYYQDGNIAIVAGYKGMLGKLSINLTEFTPELKEGEFFVKMYSEGLLINDPCFKTDLFEKLGEPFSREGDRLEVKFQLWRLKK